MSLAKACWVFLIGLLCASSAIADMVIFQNGERRFGDAEIDAASDVVLTVEGVSKVYKRHQVRDVIFGVDQADIQDATPAEPVQSPTETYLPYQPSADSIYDITGANYYRKTLENSLGREFTVDVEEFFDVPVIRVFPVSYGFFARRGTFVRILMTNRDDRTWNALQLRINLFDEEDQLLSSRDVYVFRLPPTQQDSVGRRVLEANFADVPYDRVERVQVMRRF